MKYVLDPQQVEEWSLNRHNGVSAKLPPDGQQMTVSHTTRAGRATVPEHMNMHDQSEPAVLVDFFEHPRENLLQRRFGARTLDGSGDQ